MKKRQRLKRAAQQRARRTQKKPAMPDAMMPTTVVIAKEQPHTHTEINDQMARIGRTEMQVTTTAVSSFPKVIYYPGAISLTFNKIL
jgi:hypothetical protein